MDAAPLVPSAVFAGSPSIRRVAPKSCAVIFKSTPIRLPFAAATGGSSVRQRSTQSAELGGERGRIVDRAAHGAQDADLGLEAEVTQLAAVVVVGIADAAQPRQSLD